MMELNNHERPKSKSVRAREEHVARQMELAEEAATLALQAMMKADQMTAEAKEAQAALENMRERERAMADAAQKEHRTYRKSGSVQALGLPRVESKVMERSYQRAGVVAGGTLLSSGARQATVTFKPGTFRLLELAAADNKVSLSEMVRQCVEKALHAQG